MDEPKLHSVRADPAGAGLMIAPIAATLSALAVGLAIHQQDGEYTPFALAFVTFALLCAVVSVATPQWISRLRLRTIFARGTVRSRKRLNHIS